jgi:hypothetical protein
MRKFAGAMVTWMVPRRIGCERTSTCSGFIGGKTQTVTNRNEVRLSAPQVFELNHPASMERNEDVDDDIRRRRRRRRRRGGHNKTRVMCVSMLQEESSVSSWSREKREESLVSFLGSHP